jgi:tRNA A37 methylthiotransferase MiaB
VVKTSEIVCGNIPEPDTFDMFRNRRVFIETYGCRYNFGDTDKLIEILKHKGSTLVDSANEADAIIINSCTVVGTTERRMLGRLSRYSEYDL